MKGHSIPYDASLLLGNIVPPQHMEMLEMKAAFQETIDDALEELTSFLELKKKLDATAQDMLALGVPIEDLNTQMGDVAKNIQAAATNYARVSSDLLPKIARAHTRAMKGGGSSSPSLLESPMDYNLSKLKTDLPLGSDSLEMDAQYFQFEGDGQQSNQSVASLKAFVGKSSSFLGAQRSQQLSNNAAGQTSSQLEEHGVKGTLVITANLTHKLATMYEPLVIDCDKAIGVWNTIYRHRPDQMIDPSDVDLMHRIKDEAHTAAEERCIMISGAAYGSSFVGMMHVMKGENSMSNRNLDTFAAGLQVQFDVASYLSKQGGDEKPTPTSTETGQQDYTQHARALMATNQIAAHISLVTMGIVPSIESHEVSTAIRDYAKFDEDEMLAELRTFEVNSKSSENATDAARKENQMSQIKDAKVKNMVSALGARQDESNQALDINSLMTAFTDFLRLAKLGNCGVPLNYFVKPITRSQIANLWITKYMPNSAVRIPTAKGNANDAPKGYDAADGWQ